MVENGLLPSQKTRLCKTIHFKIDAENMFILRCIPLMVLNNSLCMNVDACEFSLHARWLGNAESIYVMVRLS